MATEEEQFKADVDEALTDYGTDIEIVNYTETYDVAQGKNITVESGRNTVKAGIGNYESNVIGDLVQVGDLEVTIGHETTIAINVATDKVEFGGDEYSIVNLQPQFFKELRVANILQVRK